MKCDFSSTYSYFTVGNMMDVSAGLGSIYENLNERKIDAPDGLLTKK